MNAILTGLIFWMQLASPAPSAPADSTVRIGFTGDIFLGNWAEAHIDTHGVGYPFVAMSDLFHEMDLVVGNLENPITTADSAYVEKTYLLKARPGISQGLYDANIRAVTLANNHILDYGPKGLQSTIAELDSTGVLHFGAGMNKEEALRAATKELNGQSIAMLGFSATFPEEFWASDTSAGTAFPYEEDVLRTVRAAAADHDIVVVSFHWSAELREDPKDYQVSLAHLCIDNGADLIIGHHPHVIQGIEVYKGAPIFYSLGNFAFASFSESARVGLVADVIFHDGKVTSARALPVDVYNVLVRFQPRPLEGFAFQDAIRYLMSISVPLSPDETTPIDEDGRVILEAKEKPGQQS